MKEWQEKLARFMIPTFFKNWDKGEEIIKKFIRIHTNSSVGSYKVLPCKIIYANNSNKTTYEELLKTIEYCKENNLRLDFEFKRYHERNRFTNEVYDCVDNNWIFTEVKMNGENKKTSS